ncbi:MAG TPA: rRNA maturation RNase YbeY [Cyanobacteria bacterium UBA11049]|nr:rRNA maturation RNase YbeY [Cyanobacteria bacterium UBA11049]
MQVEVSVQDCYADSDLVGSNLDLSSHDNSPIAVEAWQTWFEHWMIVLHSDLPPAPKFELSLRLTDDVEIQTLNAQYRHIDKATDVLAFAALEVDFPQLEEMLMLQPLYLGDIVISVDTARRQAQQQGHSLSTELAWLAAHGLLHLLGWDHPDEESLQQMLEQQAFMLETVGMAIDIA